MHYSTTVHLVYARYHVTEQFQTIGPNELMPLSKKVGHRTVRKLKDMKPDRHRCPHPVDSHVNSRFVAVMPIENVATPINAAKQATLGVELRSERQRRGERSVEQ